MDWQKEALLKLEKMPQEAKEIRQTAMDDLYFFARLVNPGYMYGEIHKEIFAWMQEYTLYGQGVGNITNKLIMLPRAHLKSHMVATWAAWVITRSPEVTILYVSATAGLAITQLYAIKNILTCTPYSRYFPEYINPKEGLREKWSQDAISIDHPKRRQEGIRDATISTAGLTTNTTGWHADILIPDDLVVPENAYTEDGRQAVANKSSQFTSILNAGGFTMACGTRYHPSDIYATWKTQEYDLYNDEGEIEDRVPVWEVKEFGVEKEGVFIWPKTMRPSDKKFFGFDQQVLARIRAQYEDRVQFYAQYYNDPNDPGSNRIDRNKFQYYDRKWLKQEGGHWYYKRNKLNVYASIDFAYSMSKKSDNTAIVVIGADADGFIYVLDIDCFKSDRMSEYFKRVAELHSKWEFNKLRAEVTVAQAVIVRDLKDKLREEGLRLSVEEYRPTRNEGTKQERIASALEHRYENLQIWHFKGGYTDMLEEELVMARPAHDDIKDALASAVMIVVKPKRSRENNGLNGNVVPIHSRFGGIAFR
jgi:phage terminase large subunit-like protein